MAVTEEEATQIANKSAAPPVMNDRADAGDMHVEQFDHAQAVAGDATSTVVIGHLPPGKVRVFLAQSFIEWSALGAARVMDIGHKAYLDAEGDSVAAAPTKFDENIDMSGAGSAAMGSDAAAATGKSFVFESRDGVDIILTVAGGTIPAAATFNGQIVHAGGQ